MDISRLDNLQAVCRICLNEKENMFPFITPHTLDMIEECTSVRVRKILHIIITIRIYSLPRPKPADYN